MCNYASHIVFGDATGTPFSVKSAIFHASCIPELRAVLVDAAFEVVNEHVEGANVEMRVRIPLPSHGARVCGFSWEVSDGNIVDAIALPKQKAADVAYREAEKGRAVGKTSVSDDSKLYETTVSPLPKGQRRHLKISYFFDAPHPSVPWSLKVPHALAKCPINVSAATFPLILQSQLVLTAPADTPYLLLQWSTTEASLPDLAARSFITSAAPPDSRAGPKVPHNPNSSDNASITEYSSPVPRRALAFISVPLSASLMWRFSLTTRN